MVLSLALALATPASACGGFFCNAVDPVDQAGEVVVFEVDEEIEEVTMHVQVAYEGPAESFSWVVPVPADPQTFISPEVLFSELDAWTTPTFSVAIDYGDCAEPYDPTSDSDYTVTDTATGSAGGGVQVVSTGRVGPYDQAVLRATDADVLVDWLQANGYAVPDTLGDTLAPYLGPDTHFLALKLTKGKSTGDLAPLGLTYGGTSPAIPIGLTAVAATPDMPMRVYLLGDSRGVPLNYMHTQINPLAMPWFGGATWQEVIGLAADEAGGHAFTTTYAGTDVDPQVYWDQFDLVGLDQLVVARDWFEELAYRGFSGTDELLEVLRVHVPAPEGVDETAFYNWPSTYPAEWAALDATFDPVAATADLDATIVQPRADAQEILDGSAWITRLESLISPEEMTVDPRFGFNPDLPGVALRREATLSYVDCAYDPDPAGSQRLLELPTGHTIGLPSEAATTEATSTLLLDMVEHYALIVEELSESGPPTVIADHTGELDALEATTEPPELDPWGRPIDRTGDDEDEVAGSGAAGGCGCAASPAPAAVGGWAGLLALLLGRRR